MWVDACLLRSSGAKMHVSGIARPSGIDAIFVRCCSTFESGDVGHETGTTWNLVCTGASVANKTATTMFSGLPDLAALVPTLSDDRSTVECGDVGHETGTTWNLMCI